MGQDGTSIGKISAISLEMEVTNQIFFPRNKHVGPTTVFCPKSSLQKCFSSTFSHIGGCITPQFGSGWPDHWSPPHTSLFELEVLPNVVTYNIVISACAKGSRWESSLALLVEMPTRQASHDISSFWKIEFLWKKRTVLFLFGKEEKVPVWVRYFLRTGRVFHGFPLLIQWQLATSWKGWSFVKVWHQVRPDLRSFGPCISRETRKRDWSRWQLVDRTWQRCWRRSEKAQPWSGCWCCFWNLRVTNSP